MKEVQTIVENMTYKYNELFVKMKNLEARVAKLENDLEIEKNINKVKLTENKNVAVSEELIEEIIFKIPNNNFLYKERCIQEELIQMANEDIKIIKDEIIENELVTNELTVTNSLDDEIVDLSKEIYPVSNLNNSNQNKKGWIKTLLFM
jgi:hypothetical protein